MRSVAVPGGLLLWRRLAVALPLCRLLAVSRDICSLLLLVRSPLGRVGRIVVLLLLLIVSRPGRGMFVTLRNEFAVESSRHMP